MPTYSYRCWAGHETTQYRKVSSRNDVAYCSCGAEWVKVVDAPSILGDIKPYQSPIDGKWIDSKSARRDDLKRNGCIEWEPGIRQDLPRIRADNEAKSFAPVEATIDRTVRDLVAAGKIPT